MSVLLTSEQDPRKTDAMAMNFASQL